ncbi:MAG: (5-formylfuran-3-yl)methyl phosphate synthase [Planctomycetaceae bacterium]
MSRVVNNSDQQILLDFSSRSPQLLVSVSNVNEAESALAGGCDILDIKEPARGSLGMADSHVIDEIANHAHFASAESHQSVPVTAALGETLDWQDESPIPQLPTDLTYLKLGTAGLANYADGMQKWKTVRHRFDESAESPFAWVAVGYADWQRADAPSPAEILDWAAESGCAGVLIDTFRKDGRTLLDWISPGELATWIQSAHQTEMFVALAGSLKREHLPELMQCRPDIIAVRSAACDSGNRRGPICSEATRKLSAALKSMTNASSPAFSQ